MGVVLKRTGMFCLVMLLIYTLSPRICMASWMSLGITVTCLAWKAHKLVSLNRPTRYTSAAFWRHIMVANWNCRSVLKSWAKEVKDPQVHCHQWDHQSTREGEEDGSHWVSWSWCRRSLQGLGPYWECTSGLSSHCLVMDSQTALQLLPGAPFSGRCTGF